MTSQARKIAVLSEKCPTAPTLLELDGRGGFVFFPNGVSVRVKDLDGKPLLETLTISFQGQTVFKMTRGPQGFVVTEDEMQQPIALSYWMEAKAYATPRLIADETVETHDKRMSMIAALCHVSKSVIEALEAGNLPVSAATF